MTQACFNSTRAHLRIKYGDYISYTILAMETCKIGLDRVARQGEANFYDAYTRETNKKTVNHHKNGTTGHERAQQTTTTQRRNIRRPASPPTKQQHTSCHLRVTVSRPTGQEGTHKQYDDRSSSCMARSFKHRTHTQTTRPHLQEG